MTSLNELERGAEPAATELPVWARPSADSPLSSAEAEADGPATDDVTGQVAVVDSDGGTGSDRPTSGAADLESQSVTAELDSSEAGLEPATAEPAVTGVTAGELSYPVTVPQPALESDAPADDHLVTEGTEPVAASEVVPPESVSEPVEETGSQAASGPMTVETIEAPSSSESAVDRSAGAVTETEAETEAAVETETSGETETETPVGVDTADTTLSETPEGPIDGTVSETDATTWVPPETPDSPAPAQSEHTVTADTATMASQTVVESTGESDSAATLASAVTPADATLTPMTTPPGGVGPSDSARPRHRVRLFVLIGLGLVVVLSGVAAVFLAQHFDQRVKPGVTALGHDVAGMTDSELVAALTEWTAALTVPVTDGDQSRDIPIADLGISFDVNQLAAAALAEGRSWRPWRTYNPWWTKPAPADLTIDQTMLQDHLDDAFIPLDAQTVEAAPVFDPAVGGFVVQPSRTGEHADIAPVLAALDAYAAGQADLSRVLVPVKIDPPLFGDAAAAAAASQANQWTERQIVLDNGFSGYSRKTYQLTPAEIAQWVEITPIPDGTYAVSFDSAQAVTDLEPILNQQVATPMKPTVAVLDPDNPTEILGYEWGEAGSRVVDPAAVIGTIESALAGGQDLTYTVPLVEEPATEIEQLPPTNFDEPNGAKWIDVNKSTYTATAYEGTTQVNQFIISIGRGGVYETSDGSFYIYLKYANQVMRGGTGTVEGRYEYATPVTWVSYFNRDIAFHEADWNSAQGTWAARVSHGCVNMPGSAARWIYNWAPIGTKVVVHY